MVTSKATSCQNSKLLRIAKKWPNNWQLKVAKSCQKDTKICPKMLKAAKDVKSSPSCQNVLKVAKTWQKLPKDANSCQKLWEKKLPNVVKMWQKLLKLWKAPKSCKSYQKLQKVAKIKLPKVAKFAKSEKFLKVAKIWKQLTKVAKRYQKL